MALYLQQKESTAIPLEVEGITPERLAPLSQTEIERLEIYHGNRTVPLGEFFTVSGDASDGQVHWQGDLSGVHWIARR